MRMHRLSRRKKIIIAAAGLTLCAGAAIIGFFILKSKSAPAEEQLDYARTVVLSKGTLNNSVNVSGTVESAEVSSVTTPLTYKVTEVNVKVGDFVKTGDIIAKLDGTDIQKEIADKQKELGESVKTLQTAVDTALKAIENAKGDKTREQGVQDTIVNTAKNALDTANNELNAVTPAYNTAKSNFDAMNTGIAAAQGAYDAALAAKDSAYRTWIEAGGKAEGDQYTAYTASETVLAQKSTELEGAKKLFDAASYTASYNSAAEVYNQKLAARQAAQGAYDTANAERNKILNNCDTAVSTALETWKTADAALKKGSTNTALEDLTKKLDSTVLKAGSNGKVTELKVTVGGICKDGLVATIQSADKLIVSVKIPEYSIGKLSTGLKANITTDASADIIPGTLSRISPTALAGDAGSGFAADIAVDAPEGLFIGTKAKAEIIIFSKENVYSVPIDAIKTGDDGKSYVVIKQADGKFTDSEVTTGTANEFYTEVSGKDIKDGTEVLANAQWADLAAAQSSSAAQGGF